MILLNRCVIITSFQSAALKESFAFREDDFVICADGGYAHARREGIIPKVVIGDFDSMDFDVMEDDLKNLDADQCRILRVAAEKDDTDTMICLKFAIEQGFDEIFMIGGLGGRLDHTVANLQTMSYSLDCGKSIWFVDGKNLAALRNPGSFSVDRIEGFKLSLLSFSECCEGVCIKGVKYPLKDYRLTNSFPLGVSNEFVDEKADVSHTTGKLLIILSRD